MIIDELKDLLFSFKLLCKLQFSKRVCLPICDGEIFAKPGIYYPKYICSDCGERVSFLDDYDRQNSVMIINECDYCEKCGKKVLWKEKRRAVAIAERHGYYNLFNDKEDYYGNG